MLIISLNTTRRKYFSTTCIVHLPQTWPTVITGIWLCSLIWNSFQLSHFCSSPWIPLCICRISLLELFYKFSSLFEMYILGKNRRCPKIYSRNVPKLLWPFFQPFSSQCSWGNECPDLKSKLCLSSERNQVSLVIIRFQTIHYKILVIYPYTN